MGLYEQIKEVATAKGYSINRLEKELGFPRSSISKYNKNIPSMEKIQKIADFLHVSIADITGEEKEGGEKYYLNEETAEMAQKLFENNDLRELGRNGFLDNSYADDTIYDCSLSDVAIVKMENQKKETLLTVADFISKFIP